jgi:hypothetical protein
MATDVDGEERVVVLQRLTFMAGIAAAQPVARMAVRSRILAAQWRKLRRGSIVPYCRRVYATTVAVPVFPAVRCGAKVATRWRVSALPPSISATISPIAPTKKTGFPAFFGNSAFCIG